MKRIAVLGPELPSVSMTFVYREAALLERQGLTVVPFSLHTPSLEGLDAEALSFAAKVQPIYGRGLAIARDALLQCVKRPKATLASLGLALRDVVRGRFTSVRQRCILLGQWSAGMALAHRIRRSGCEHLHVHFSHSPATVAMYAAHAAGVPFSVTSHANDLYVHASLLREKVQRAQPFFTISEANREFLRSELGELGGQVLLSRCGVDTTRFSPSTRADGTTLLGVGRLVPKKGFDLLLRAFARAAKARPELRLVIAGDGPERGALETLGRGLGLEDRVSFLGQVTGEQVLEQLAEASAFVLPCRKATDGDRDGIPVVLMEAMACGVPVISTRLSGIPELINDRESGRLVEPGDLDSLEAALRERFEHPRLAEERAVAAREHVLEAYDSADNARRLIAEIERAATRSSRNPGDSLRGDWLGATA